MKNSFFLTLSALFFASGCSDAAGEAIDARTRSLTQALPTPPQQGSDFDAERAFVGDPLRGMGPGEPGNLFTLAADDAAGMASTTKSFTLLLAVEAVEKGKVSLDDYVVISAKAAGVNDNHGGATHSNAGLVAGEPIRFEDLLYAVMLPSGGDASIAVAQHVAVSTYPYLASESDAEQEAAFVGMMNDRAAELGLNDTVFFNAYGGDHFHFDDNTPGDSVPHRASTRDMARWFHFGMQKPLFRQVAGFQGTYAFVGLQGNFFAFTQSFGYPGVTGSKGGSNTACETCGITESRRIGRDLVMAYTQGKGGDGSVLLDYGFASLFSPVPRADSSTYTGGWAQTSLACVNADRAASAVVQPSGGLRILLWGVDLDSRSPSITHLNDSAVLWTPPGAFVIDRGGPPDGPRLPPGFSIRPDTPEPPLNLGFAGVPPGGGLPPAADTFAGNAKPTVFTEARIQYAENGNLVVAAANNNGVHLYSYGITNTNTVVQRDMELVGPGTDPRVFVLNANLVVTAHRDGAGDLVLKSWRLDPITGALGNDPLDTRFVGAAMAGDVELSGRPGLAVGYHLMLAYRGASGGRTVRNYDVVHQSGEIVAKSALFGDGPDSRIALTPVKGIGDNRDVYALAFRNGNGELVVEAYEYTATGSLFWRGATTDVLIGGNALTAQARIQISGYREGGVFVAIQSDPNVAVQRLEPWSFDPSGTSSNIKPNRVTGETIAESGLASACRVPNMSAEGDFLISTGALPLEGLKLRAFRSAPRQ